MNCLSKKEKSEIYESKILIADYGAMSHIGTTGENMTKL